MSRPVHERLRQLEAEVRNLQMLPAAAVRERGRRRGRRQMAAVMAGVAVVATTAGITATRALDSHPFGTDTPEQAAGPGMSSFAAVCDLTLPSDPSQVRIHLLDGGTPLGVEYTAGLLRERRFTVENVAGTPSPGYADGPSYDPSADPSSGATASSGDDSPVLPSNRPGASAGSPSGGVSNDPAGPTVLRYGPAAVGAAIVLRAAFIDETTMRFDPARTDETIDLRVGTTFIRLATPTEVNQALAAAGQPSAMPGC
jgi:hypothetical protein